MQELDPESLLEGKDDDMRTAIAGRVGAYLCDGGLAPSDRRAAELVAHTLVDDAIERVRVALCEAIKHAKNLPRSLALKLAHDVESVSGPFLAVTEVFSDRDWQQLLLTISRGSRRAVAGRACMSESLAIALVAMGDTVVAEALVGNLAAPITGPVYQKIVDKFAAEIRIFDKLAARTDLLTDIVVDLVEKVSAAVREKLQKAYQQRSFTGSLADEAEVNTLLELVRNSSANDQIGVATTLFNRNKLTPALLLKAQAEGRRDFFEAGLSVLSGLSPDQVKNVILRAGTETIDRFFTRARIPDDMRRAFQDSFRDMRRIQGNQG